jgi:hypothetical protein
VELLAGQDRGLDRVRERVDVHHPDALQLGDAVEVEVVRQDHAAARQGEGDQLRVDLGDVLHRVVDDLDRGPGFLLHAASGSPGRAARVAPQRVGAVGDVLDLLEDEPRHDKRPVDEADSTMSAIRPSMIALVSTTMCGHRAGRPHRPPDRADGTRRSPAQP